MANEVRIKLTDEQKAKIKAATGQELNEIQVGSFGDNPVATPPRRPISGYTARAVSGRSLSAKSARAESLSAKSARAESMSAKSARALSAKSARSQSMSAKSARAASARSTRSSGEEA
jgi:hypothetical protein